VLKCDRDKMKIPHSDPKTQLMESCVERENMLKAWNRVKQNGGSAGVDSLSIEETAKDLKTKWTGIRDALLKGSYKPKPVRKVEIEKSGGGVRQLGIPTVTDRLVQQCMLQVLQPLIDPTFHKHSFGFRPGKSAHQAIRQAQAFIQEGRIWVVDVDLEKFFDRVNHDILMDRVMKRIKDERVVKLIRLYLRAGIMEHGVCITREEGAPQGGPLSPLLANLLLDEVDWELEKRGLAFCRYADDCNIYVRSERAAQRVMQTMQKLVAKLKLKINQDKSAVAKAKDRKFLGFAFWTQKGSVKRAVAKQAIKKFKERVRVLTSRTCGKSLEEIIDKLDRYLVGWRGYFQLADTPRIFGNLDSWIRRRLRMLQLKHWKRGTTCFRELRARGVSKVVAATSSDGSRGWWHRAGTHGMNLAMPNSFFDALELSRLTG
jgi:RNA-directed DNA polymerase